MNNPTTSQTDHLPIIVNNDDKGNLYFALPSAFHLHDFKAEPISDSWIPRGHDIHIPWQHRQEAGAVAQKDLVKKFDTFRSPQVWRQILFAVRISCIAVLLPALWIALDAIPTYLFSETAIFAAVVLGSRITWGSTMKYMTQFLYSTVFWLPLSVLGAYLSSLTTSHSVWYIYYVIVLFLLGSFTTETPRRICLLLFNNTMISIINSGFRLEVPGRLWLDWCFGTLFCVLAMIFPYPISAHKDCGTAVRNISRCIGTSVEGLVTAFWKEKPSERNVALVHVRYTLNRIDDLFKEVEHSNSDALYEIFVFEWPEERRVRGIKIKILEKLRVNVSMLSRVLDIIEDQSFLSQGFEKQHLVRETLGTACCNTANYIDVLMFQLSEIYTRNDLKAFTQHLDYFDDVIFSLQLNFSLVRRNLVNGMNDIESKEMIHLLTFLLFSLVSFNDTLQELRSVTWEPLAFKQCFFALLKFIFQPIQDAISFLRLLFTKRRREEFQILLEAAKTAVAMLLSMLFFVYSEKETAFIGGPAVIAFVSGTNPVQVVQESDVRLMGCLVGTVVGMFASDQCAGNKAARVACFCVLMFIGTLFRNGEKYGAMWSYGMFVLIPQLSITPPTPEDSISRLKQATFSMIIYSIISMLVFPVSPSSILRKMRSADLQLMSINFSKIMSLFVTPISTPTVETEDGKLHASSQVSPPIFMSSKQYEDKTSISSSISENQNPNNHLPDRNFPSYPTLSGCHKDIELENAHSPLRRHLSKIAVDYSTQALSHRKIDPSIEPIKSSLRELRFKLKRALPYMNFSANERGLTKFTFPVRSSTQVHEAFSRSLTLLRMMLRSFEVIRLKPLITPEMTFILRSLFPIARQMAEKYEYFAELLSFELHDPLTQLEGELTEVVSEIAALSEKFNDSKDALIIKSLQESSQCQTGSELKDVKKISHDPDTEISQASNMATPPPHSPNRTLPQSETKVAFSGKHEQNSSKKNSESIFKASSKRSLARNLKSGQSSSPPYLSSMVDSQENLKNSPLGSPRGYKQEYRQVINTSLAMGAISLDWLKDNLPDYYSNDDSNKDSQVININPSQAVKLSEKLGDSVHHPVQTDGISDTTEECLRELMALRHPIMNQDMEGLDSFGICLGMFAKETRLLLLNFTDMVQHRRHQHD